MSNQPNSNPTNTTPGTNNPRRYWCHQCQREIVPMLAPYPTCQRCQGDFVEEIEGDNDLRDFGDQNGGHESEEESEESTNALPGQNAQNIQNHDVLQLLQTMLQTFVGPNVPLHVETTTYGDSRNGGTTTTTTATITAGGTTFNDFNGDHRPNVFVYGPGTHPQNGQENNTDGQTPIHNFLQLLQRTFSEGAQQNPNWMNFLNMVGDPRDYVWGPGGLDNIISQLMEQTAEQAPPPATDEIINDLPKVNVTKKQVAEEQLNCPICKDEFNENETATCLPCKHTFHDGCIRPWLKMNGTCPVCRYSLVSQEENNDQNRNAGGPGNGNSNRSGNGGPDNNFNGNPPSSSSQSSARFNLPGSYPLTQQQNGQQNRQNEEQSHDIVHEPLD